MSYFSTGRPAGLRGAPRRPGATKIQRTESDSDSSSEYGEDDSEYPYIISCFTRIDTDPVTDANHLEAFDEYDMGSGNEDENDAEIGRQTPLRASRRSP